MTSPFPGMDPYLEDPRLWFGIQLSLIIEIRALLVAQIRPSYWGRIDERVYRTDREEIHDVFLKVIERKSRETVTLIEILKPANKVPGSVGRDNFEARRREATDSLAHWVEIDLLRRGTDGTSPHEHRPTRIPGEGIGERRETSGPGLADPTS